MSSHPASSFKVMVAVGVMFAVERGLIDLKDDATLNITVCSAPAVSIGGVRLCVRM